MVIVLPGFGLLELAAIEGLAAGEATLERVPVCDLGFAELPAQEDEPVPGERVEVQQPAIQVLEDAAPAADRLDPLRELLAQGVAATLEPLESDRVGVALRGARAG